MGVRHVTVRLTVNQANWLGGALPLGDVRVKVLEALAKPPRKATGRPFQKKPAFAPGSPGEALNKEMNNG